MSNSRPYLLLCRSPLHVGCGLSLDDIDLPVMRNVVTGHPMVPGSTLKGCIQEPAATAWSATAGSRLANETLASLFGAEDASPTAPVAETPSAESRKRAGGATGMLCPQDAQLLAMPVASLAGGWAWATSPAVLHRLGRRLLQCGAAALPPVPEPPAQDGNDVALVAAGTPLVFNWADQRRLALADIPLLPEESTTLSAWACWIARSAYPGDEHWQSLVESRFVVVDDEVFDHFCRAATDVRSRNSIGDEGVTDDKFLWREECVPEESLFYGTVSVQAVQDNPGRLDEAQALGFVKACSLQIGGKASVGYGFVDFMPLDAGDAPAGTP